MGLLQLVLRLGNLAFRLPDTPVPYLGHPLVVALPLGLCRLLLQRFYLGLFVLDGAHKPPFLAPLCPHFIALFAELGQLFAQRLELYLITLSFYRLAFYLELPDAPFYLVEFLGQRIHLKA